MAQYTKVTKDGKVQYQLDGKDIDGKEVPVVSRNALAQQADGYVVDETGEQFNPDTDTDESEDEPAPNANNNDSDGDGQDDDGDDGDDGDGEEEPAPAKPKSKPRTSKPRARKQTPIDQDDPQLVEGAPQDEDGMGFKRAKGKTLSIFSNVPHETVKNIRGVMAPMTHEEYNTKTDAEVIARLEELEVL